MKKIYYLFVLMLLSACSDHMQENIDMAYVKDCNDHGGRVERIEYSNQLQCIGAQNRSDAK
jgi:hypothetical protein